jgi:aspartyl-tRNA(Asn)/glutamyl-tRNA(Gln) amidotransferase subunit B
LTAERSTSDLFEEIIAKGCDPKRACNLLTQEGLRLAKERDCSVAELGIKAENMAELANMVEAGDISASASSPIFINMVETKKDPWSIAEKLNLIQKSDVGELETIVDQVLAQNPKAVDDVKSAGKKSKKALGFLLGQVIQKTKGQANPKVVSQILTKKLG